MARQRSVNVFSLSFLDIMSCGFGAVILIYIVINHGTEFSGTHLDPKLQAKVSQMRLAVEAESRRQFELRDSIKLVNDQVELTRLTVEQKLLLISELRASLEIINAKEVEAEKERESLELALRKLETEIQDVQAAVAASEEAGRALRNIEGQGDRQYLTGLRMGGDRILILLDSSASMLDETIVNVIRLRNSGENEQKSSFKWQRSLRTVEWITANMIASSQFLVVTFNSEISPLTTDNSWNWIPTRDKVAIDQTFTKLKSVIPSGGTNLSSAFEAISKLDPAPDNIFLLTDGLPTQGERPNRSATIDASERLRLFSDAIGKLPLSIPINVILFPMEGDPMASPSYWRLAQMTGGSFLSPPEDWP